ncbi:PREDICTED: probable L-type lectin-domain containing receptor kinase S.5 [Camelina sativa]|uniref:non-specific serine/threonine protein kinase n=1 Tax=Camelina sativa TaxID=90675 RepID=A0ABM0V8Q0_CAMSA|nr:PREDICTED: probable L-type lectin-domain containing receptor kinase S.5 [Camelina sativa]
MRFSIAWKLLFSLLTIACKIETQVKCLEFDFPGFNVSDYPKMILENSLISLGAIQVTPDVRGFSIANQAGRALYKKPFTLWRKGKIATFNTTFVINISNQTDPGGEGLAFVLTSEKTAPHDSSGMWLGLVNEKTNMTRTSRIVAVEFDTRKSHPGDLDGNHIGLNLNSIDSVVQESLSSRGIMISSKDDLIAHVRYDGKNISVHVSRNLDVYEQRNLVFSRAIDLSAYLPKRVYVGFTASTSNFTELNCVKSWRFEGLEIDGDRKLLWLWITIPSVCVLVIGAFLGGLYLRSRSKAGETNPDIEAELDNCAANPQKFKLRELKRATGNFGVENKLGQGGFGMVFKGKWQGRDIAVKRVSEKSHQGKQEFISEITTIGNLNHRNLVKLLGWCYERKEYLLVYEFMPNGSLDRYLFLGDTSRSNLTWETRKNIITGLSQALEYLHNGCEKRILHRDIKASNVMLDSDFNAKLGDFGLARMIQQSEMTHHSTKEIAGTPGYMAPETFLNGRATVETDVYAFGVLMLEVVSGKKPSYVLVKENQTNYNNSIVNWLWELYRNGTIRDAADPGMESLFDEEEMKSVLLLGLACCHPNPNQRPSMKTVLKVLTGETSPPDVPTERPAFMWPAMPPSFSDTEYSLPGSQIHSLTELTGR